MENIVVYPSRKQHVIVLIGVIVLIAFLVVLDRFSSDPLSPMIWLTVAAPSLVPIGRTVYYLITNRPSMFITDEGIKVNSKEPWEVRFADVESFYPVVYRGFNLIGIRYKKDCANWKSDEEMEEGRKERILTRECPGAPYEIPADRLSMKKQQLLDLLNGRLSS